MSFEKVKISGIVERTNRETGKVSRFLSVEVLNTHQIYMTDAAQHNSVLFERFKGQEVLIPAVWSTYNGKPSLSFEGDAVPVPLVSTQLSAPVSVPSDSSNPLNRNRAA